jgi:hypothetical protein
MKKVFGGFFDAVDILDILTLSLLVDWIMDRDGINIKNCPKDVDPALWEKWFPKDIDKAGKILGYLERIAFFIIALIGNNAYQTIFAWFALKVASKWNVWTHVKKPSENEGNAQDKFKDRNIIGTMLYGRFLIGTLSNVIIGLAAGSIVKWLWNLI